MFGYLFRVLINFDMGMEGHVTSITWKGKGIEYSRLGITKPAMTFSYRWRLCSRGRRTSAPETKLGMVDIYMLESLLTYCRNME